VVIYPIDAMQVAMAILQHAPDVTEEVFAAIGPQYGFSVLGGKHEVVTDLGVGRHALILRSSTPLGLRLSGWFACPQVKTCGYPRWTPSGSGRDGLKRHREAVDGE